MAKKQNLESFRSMVDGLINENLMAWEQRDEFAALAGQVIVERYQAETGDGAVRFRGAWPRVINWLTSQTEEHSLEMINARIEAVDTYYETLYRLVLMDFYNDERLVGYDPGEPAKSRCAEVMAREFDFKETLRALET
jgi:hypothetical protein